MWDFARSMLMLKTAPVCYPQIKGVNSMSRYESASHVFCCCQYHLVWTAKYRYKTLKGNPGKELYRSIYIYCHMKKCTVAELNVQIAHVHLVVRSPLSVSVSELMGFVKGRTAIRVFAKFPYLRKQKQWGNPFWQRVTL